MPLQLKFNNQFLVHVSDQGPESDKSKNRVTITTESGAQLPCKLITVSHGLRDYETTFATQLKDMPEDLAETFRSKANVIQKYIHDHAPRYRYPRSGGLLPDRDHRGRRRPHPSPRERKPIELELPPETIELEDTHLVSLKTMAIYRGMPCLEVGDMITFVGLGGFGSKRGTGFRDIVLKHETITAFELN